MTKEAWPSFAQTGEKFDFDPFLWLKTPCFMPFYEVSYISAIFREIFFDSRNLKEYEPIVFKNLNWQSICQSSRKRKNEVKTQKMVKEYAALGCNRNKIQ